MPASACSWLIQVFPTKRIAIQKWPKMIWQPGDIVLWKETFDDRIWHAHNEGTHPPFTRNGYIVGTQDLELDLRINPDFSYEWKDPEEYQKGIQTGMILPDWIPGIETAKREILEKLEKRQYPFDGLWLDWTPDPAWSAPKLPLTWDKM